MTVASPKLRLKTDNHSLEDKLRLRREVVELAGFDKLQVLDLFAGEGNIWKALRKQPRKPDGPPALNVTKYTPVDAAQRQPGQIRFKITPRLIASLDTDGGLQRYNVIDVDCYGDPWDIWQAILFRIKKTTCVFMTRGKVTYGAGRMPISNLAKQVMGIPKEWNVPGKIELLDYADRCQLLQKCPTACIVDGLEIKLSRVDYYGVVVSPLT
jgi:hypothetical protein